jgi:preprotein translocase subunit SecE
VSDDRRVERVATDTRDAAPRTDAGGRGARGGRGRGRKRATPLQFYREVVAELRKVNYPGRSELVTYVIVVLVFVTCMVALTASLDFGLTKLVLAVFG